MRNKLIAAGAGLFGYGVLVGWAVTADFYERKMKRNQQLLGEIINRQGKELEATKALLISTQETMQPYSEADVEAALVALRTSGQSLLDAVKDATFESDPEEADEEPYDEAKTEAIRTNLQGLIDTYTNDPDEVNHFNEITAKAIENDERPPFVISREKFAWDEEEGDEYDKIQLTYYPRDRILLDDEQDVVDDVGNLVGWKNLSQFGGESGDADVVFVRNPRLQTDFEVVRDTENQLPAHVRFSMGREEYETNKAAGLIRFGREGRD